MGTALSISSIKCPGCMAPLPAAASGSAVVTCEFCGNSYTFQEAENETSKLRSDVLKWISDIAGRGGTGGVDETSRLFIYRNNLFPPIKIAVERATEVYQPVRFLPLFSFPLIDQIPRNPFLEAMSYSPDVKDLAASMKEVMSQIQAPELASFVIGGDEKLQLKIQEMKCLELVYLSNLRHGIALYTEEGLSQALTNLSALEELYGSLVALFDKGNPAALFLEATIQRVSSVKEAVSILLQLWKSRDGIAVTPLVERMDNAVSRCEAAVQGIASSGIEPQTAVPAEAGAKDDIIALKVFRDCIKVFADSGSAESGMQFEDFLHVLESIVSKSIPAHAKIGWLEDFVGNLSSYLAAFEGKEEVPVVSDFTWVKAVSEAGIRSSMFSGKEQITSLENILVPCWVAAIQFSAQSGSLFWKKGHGVDGYLYCEAGRPEGTCFIESSSSDFLDKTSSAIESPGSLSGQSKIIAPVVCEDDALKWMKKKIAESEQFRNSHLKIISLIYIPAAIAVYATKKQSRTVCLVPSQGIELEQIEVSEFAIGNRQILTILKDQ